MANEEAGKTASAEVHFAQRLAANEKKIRDRAMKKLKKWLEVKSMTKKEKAFTEADFLKIWKGLHYCLWMQDKPLLQEEMSAFISRLVHVFSHPDTTLLFIQVYLQTEAREWNGIDRWRMDKFMMLFRNMLTQSLEFLKKQKWKKSLLTKFTDILSSKIMTVEEESVPDGLKIHLADIYLDELEKIGSDELAAEKVLTLLRPFTKYIQNSRNHVIVERVLSRVFEAIIEQTVTDALTAAEKQIEKEDNSDEDKGDAATDDDDVDIPPRLQIDFKALADELFQLGSSKDCVSKNRSLIYTLVKKFKDLDEGILPVEETEDDTGDVLSKKDIAEAVQKLEKLDAGTKKKKKKKNAKDNNDKDMDMQNNSSEETKTCKRKIEDGSFNKDMSPEKKKKLGKKETIKPKENMLMNNLGNKTKTKGSKEKKSNKKHSTDKELHVMQEDKREKKSQKSDVNEILVETHSSDVENVEKKKKTKNVKIEISEKNVISELEGGNPSQDTETPQSLSKSKEKSQAKPRKSVEIVEMKKDSLSETSQEEVIEVKASKKRKKSSNFVEKSVEVIETVSEEKKTPTVKNNTKMKKLIEESTQNNSPKPEGGGFAKFDKLMKTPPAFVRKSISKLSTPKSAVKKTALEPPLSCPADTKKKVIFNMKKNESVSFQDSIKFSPDAFNPLKTPDQGILKTPSPAVTRSKSLKKQKFKTPSPSAAQSKAAKQKRRASTGVIKRSMAADFF